MRKYLLGLDTHSMRYLLINQVKIKQAAGYESETEVTGCG